MLFSNKSEMNEKIVIEYNISALLINTKNDKQISYIKRKITKIFPFYLRP